MSAKNSYLVLYNAVSLGLWTYLTGKTLVSLPELYQQSNLQALYPALISPYLTATQTLALLEVLHAALGLVRASPATTALQVGGKNLVVWTVMAKFPELMMGKSGIWGFIGCVIAWGFSEMIRYGFFTVQLTTGSTPSWLKWLRYSGFIVLYPVGLASEAWLVYLSLIQGTGINAFYRGYLFLGLLTYLPAGPFLYKHMLSQRRRTLKKDAQKQ